VSGLMQLEWAQLIRSSSIRAVLGVFIALMIYALWVGAAEQSRWRNAVHVNRAATERAIAREQENVQLNRQEGFNPPGAPAAQTMDASLPPAPGVFLAVGDAALRPVSAAVTTASRADTLFKNVETGSAISASLGALDLTWVVVVLMPLLVIAFGHDLLAAERDTGRLGLLRTQASSLGRLIARRLVIRMGLPLALIFVGALAALYFDVPARLAVLWWLIASLYLLMWGLIAALVSVRTQSSQSSAAILILVWLGFVIALPAVLSLAIERLAPTASRLSQVIALREVQLSLQPRTSELLDRYLVDHPELAGASRTGFARASFVAQRETEAQLAPVLAKYEQARQRQVAWNTGLSWLSPSMLTHAALTHIAGTDSARHAAFVQQATQFAAVWREHLREQLFLDRNLSPEQLAALPRFRFEEPSTLSRAMVALLYLLGLIAILAGLLRRALGSAELR
jgi:ABC-2 type transport system permease protein